MPDGYEQANLFELHGHTEFWGHAIEVTYSSTTITGQPHLSYRDKNVIYSFTGDEIRILDTVNPEDLGQLVTVTLESGASDLPPVSFTLILPVVNVLSQSVGTRVQVPGVLTTTRSLFGGARPARRRPIPR